MFLKQLLASFNKNNNATSPTASPLQVKYEEEIFTRDVIPFQHRYIIVSVSHEGSIKIWNCSTNKCRTIVCTNGIAMPVRAVQLLAPDYIVSCDGAHVRVLDMFVGHVMKTFVHRHAVEAMDFNQQGTGVVALANHMVQMYAKWTLAAAPVQGIVHPDKITSVKMIKQGTVVITACKDALIRMINVEQRKLIYVMSGHLGEVTSLCLVGEHKLVTSCTQAMDAIRVWNLQTMQCEHVWSTKKRGINCIQQTNEKYLCTGDKYVRMWKMEEGKCIRIFKGHTSTVRAVACDRRKVASASDDGTVRVWDLQTKECLLILKGHASFVTGVALYSHGRNESNRMVTRLRKQSKRKQFTDIKFGRKK